MNGRIPLVTLIITLVNLVACSSPDRNDDSSICNQYPFEVAKVGLEIELPMVPISFQISTNGVTPKIETSVDLKFLVFALEPYLTFGTSDAPPSPCLKVEVFNPEWDGQYSRFYVNFTRNNLFRVRVNTEEVTEFVFSRERWFASPPGEREFVRYEYATNTLHLDASSGRVHEFTVMAEKPESSAMLHFCVDELERTSGGRFVPPHRYLLAQFQDQVNVVRDRILDQFGTLGGSVVIYGAFLGGIGVPVTYIVKRRGQVSFRSILPLLVFLLLWICFWIAVYQALPACWG